MKIINLPSTKSTNTHLSSIASEAEEYTVVTTDAQTDGRGQRGNSWESEPGKNLTFSVLLKPEHILATDQFIISQAVSVAIACVLAKKVNNNGEVSVKWPNDIYVDNQKICGILIENSLMGSRIRHSIVGIGLNVNQKQFKSDAPNPVSLIHVTGEETDRVFLLDEICSAICRTMESTKSENGRNDIIAMYKSMIWHREGVHKYRIPGGETFRAEIVDIAPSGHITLRDTDGTDRIFAFKEVQYIL